MGVEIAAIHGKLVLEDGFSSPSDKLLSLIPKLSSAIDSLTSKIDSIGKRSSSSVPKAADDTEKLKAAYDKLSARIDPVIAGQQKLAQATSVLEAAHKKWLITHEQYTEQLEKANKKFSDTTSWVDKLSKALGGEIGSKFSALGEFATKFGGEAGEALEKVGSKAGVAVSGLSELASYLGPLLPLAIAFAAALLAVGVAFEAFEFIKDAVAEGLILQGVIERLNDSLRNTGSYSGLSSHEIIELAGSYALLTGRTKEEEIAAALVLTRFKNLNEEGFRKGLDVVNAYARAQGITAEEAAKKLGPALDGNSRSMRVLKDIGVDLTTGQQATLKAMVDTGNVAEFQAKLFAILTEKVGLAAGAHETLGIQAGRAKFVLSEFKEGVASELIPALEDLGKDIFGGIDDWKRYAKSASEMGHSVGDVLRQIVYGFAIMAHGIAIAWDNLVILIDKGILYIADKIHSLADLMSLVPGPLQSAWVGIARAVDSAAKTAISSLISDSRALDNNKTAIDRIAKSYLEHRQALEGDTKTQDKHTSAQDAVASSQKKANDLVSEGVKAIQAYTDKLSDLADKLTEQNKEEVALYTALQNGLEAYYRELLVQERRKAVLAEVTQLTTAHRTEIEKLQEQLKKADDEKRYADAAKLKGMIDASNDSFERQKKAVSDLAGENVDLKHSTDALLQSNKSNLDFTGKQVEAWAQLTDALTGTSIASREASIQADISRRVLDSLKNTQEDLSASIIETVRREHEFTDSMKDALDVAKELSKLSNQASLQTAISRIDSSLPQYLQRVEEQYLQTIAGIGHGSIEEGQRIIDATQKALESLGIHIGNISKTIRDNLLAIQDAQIIQSVRGAAKTPTDLYHEQVADIERILTDHALRARIIEQSGKDALIQIDLDANAKLLQLEREHIAQRLDNWNTFFGFLGHIFGGFVQQISNAISNIQGAYQSGSKLDTSGFGSAAGLAGSWGIIFAEVEAFYEVYQLVDAYIKKHNAAKNHTVTQLEIVGGDWSSPSYFDEAGRQFSVAIRKLVQQISDSIGGVLKDLPQITVRARADGKAFSVYVAGVWLGTFKDAQSAMEAGVAQAIEQANFAGVSKEIAQVLKQSLGATLQELEDSIKTATDVRTARLGDEGERYVELSDKYRQMVEAARRAGLATDDLINAWKRAETAEKNQVLGIDSTASDRLAALSSLSKGITEASSSMEATLQQQIEDITRQIAALEHQASSPLGGGNGQGPGIGDGGPGPIQGPGSGSTIIDGTNYNLKVATEGFDSQLAHLREVLAQYTAELDKIPKALTDQEINMGIFDTLYQYLQNSGKYAKQAAEWARVKVEIEFAQIKAQLLLLGKWEEFQAMFNDAYNAALAAAGKAPGRAGGGKGRGSDVESFIADRTYQLQIAGLDSYHQKLAQIQKDYDEQLKAAGKNTKQRQELLALEAQEIALAKQQNQTDVVSRFNELVGKNDAFTQLHDKFSSMADDIKGAGLGAKKTAGMIAELTKAEVDATHTLAQQDLGNLFGNLANYISDQTLKQQALQAAAQIKFQLDMLSYKADFELLKAKGVLTQKEIDQVQNLFNYIDAHAPDLSGGGGGDSGTGSGSGAYMINPNTGRPVGYNEAIFQDQQAYLASIGKDAQSLKSAMDLLRSYQEDSEDELTKHLNKIRSDFSTISSALGNTAEVISAKNSAISKAISDFLEPINSFRNGLDFGSNSLLSGEDQFTSVRDQFRALVAKGPGLADRDELLRLSDLYEQAGRAYTAGEGLRFIDKEVRDALNNYQANVPGLAGIDSSPLGSSANPMAIEAPNVQQAIINGNTLILDEMRNQSSTLSDINTSIRVSSPFSGMNGAAAA